MNIWLKNLILLLGLITTAAILLMWAETEKEINVLCSMISPGHTFANTVATLETGNFLEYSVSEQASGQIINVSSPYNLWSSACEIAFTPAGQVGSAEYREGVSILTLASLTGGTLSVLLVIFQLMLAFGLPIGRFAWGGEHTVLPTRLKTASFVSSLVVLFCATLFIEAGTETQILPGTGYQTPALGLFMILFGLSTFANLNSSSLPERLTGTPAAFLLCMSCFVVLLF